MKLAIIRLPHGVDLPLPTYGTSESAGLDLHAALESPITLLPGSYQLVPTGIRIALEPGTEGQVRSRSGLSLKHGVVVLNAPGTIDADYRGEIKVILMNHGKDPFIIEHGMRIAQLVIAPYLRCEWTECPDEEHFDKVTTTESRGIGGFGSTGLKAHLAGGK